MKVSVLLLAILFLVLSSIVHAADPETKSGVKFIAGASAFLDEESPLDHFVIGGAGFFVIKPRLRIEPQFLYMDGPDTDRDISLTGNISYDVWLAEKTALYVVGGGGLLRHTQDFATGPFSTNDWTATGGIGARFYITNKLFLAPEFRVGWEPLYQVTGSAGFEF